MGAKIKKSILLLFTNPSEFFRIVKAFILGSIYCAYYNLFTKKIHVGFPFFVFAPFKLNGPGEIVIGKNCRIFYNVFRGVHVSTLSTEAKINIGKGASLGGITIRAKNKITIKDDLLAAFSLIQDYVIASSILPAPLENNISEIYIGNQVWIGGQACVLGGSCIEDGCILTMGTVTNSIFKKTMIIVGNPAKRGIPINLFLRG